MLDYAILGTSNSVMKVGYVPFLADLLGTPPTANHSIGGTPNLLLPYVACQADLSPHRVAIIDTSVNDVWATDAGAVTLDDVHTHFVHAIRRLEALGCRPLLLVMPTIHDRRAIAEVRRLVHDLAARQSVPVVDGYSVVEAVLACTAMDERELFLDAGHVVPPISAMIAGEVARRVEALAAAPPQAASAEAGAFPYAFRLAEPNPDSPRTIERRSTITRRRYLRLEAGDPQAVDLGGEWDVIGFALNKGESSAVVEIAADGAAPVAYDLRFAGTPETVKGFQHGLAPVPAPFRARSLTLRALSPQEADAVAPVRLQNAKGSGQNRGSAEIEGFILQAPGSGVPAPPAEAGAGAGFPGYALTPQDRVAMRLIAIDRDNRHHAQAGRTFRRLFAGRNLQALASADLYRDLGAVSLELGDGDLAMRLLRIAHDARPSGAHIQRMIERARAMAERAS